MNSASEDIHDHVDKHQGIGSVVIRGTTACKNKN
jgi:hypothetical protein